MRRSFAACWLLAAALPAQTTHLVGPGGVPTIAEALAVAAPGDVVLVQSGIYPGFATGIGVTIRALGAVQINVTSFLPWNVPAGQRLDLDGITISGWVFANGTVAMTDCGIVNGFGAVPAITASGNLHLIRCSVSQAASSQPSSALHATDAHVTATGTSFAIAWTGTAQTTCLQLDDSTLVASGCTIEPTTLAGWSPPAIRVTNGSRVWLSDSIVATGQNSCAFDDQGGTFRVDRCSLSPSTATGCAAIQPGPALLGVEQPTMLQNGAPFTLHFRAAPLEAIAVHASLGLGTYELPGLFEQPVALDLTNYFFVGIYATDANGVASATWNMPAGLFVDSPLWFATITVDPTFPWQVAPIAGGIIR